MNIKAGNGGKVALELSRLPRSSLSLEQLPTIANLSWRINRPAIGLRLLYPELRRRQSLSLAAHPEIFTEYAACLLEVGALPEAKRILNEVQEMNPKAKFYRALLLFKEWNYAEAVPLLESYLREIPPDYHHKVVRVNLASAYVNVGEWEKAEATLAVLKKELAGLNHQLLLGNCFEIGSQVHFQRREFRKALQELETCEQLLAGLKNMGWLYCQKWKLINRLHENPLAAGAGLVLEAEKLRVLARSMRSWETLREIDFHLALCTGNSDLFNHVLYGTPSAHYRNRLTENLEKWKSSCQVFESYNWKHGNGSRAENSVNLRQTIASGQPSSFLLRKLFLTLASDFYAPFRVGPLFSILFAGEFYNLDSSPDRVFQAIRKLRIFFTKTDSGLEVKSSDNGYTLVSAGGHGLQIERSLLSGEFHDEFSAQVIFLREHFGKESFSSRQLGERMRCSTRTANRLLKELRSRGEVESSGSARFTRFKLVS